MVLWSKCYLSACFDVFLPSDGQKSMNAALLSAIYCNIQYVWYYITLSSSYSLSPCLCKNGDTTVYFTALFYLLMCYHLYH